MQALGQAADQILQRIADGDLGAGTLSFLLSQLLQIAVDGGLGSRIAQRHPDRVHGRMRALRTEGVPCALHIAFVQARPSHLPTPCYFVIDYIPRNYVTFNMLLTAK